MTTQPRTTVGRWPERQEVLIIPNQFSGSITIRCIQAGDESALLDFYLSLSEADAHFFTPWPFIREAVAGHVTDAVAGSVISLVAADKHGHILGHGFIQHLRPDPQNGLLPKRPAEWLWRWATGLIRKSLGRPAKPRLGIGVHSSVRGTGLSRRLMQRLLDEARSRRSSTIALGVHKSNEKARALYEKMGFRIVRELSQQQRKDSYEMELDLRQMNPTASQPSPFDQP